LPTAPLNTFPAYLDLDFSAPLLLTSLSADDLTVKRQRCLRVTVLDADSVRFDLAGLNTGDDDYTVELAGDALTSIQQAGNDYFSLSFAWNATPPTVIGTSVGQDERLFPGDLTFTAQFSEGLDPALGSL